MSSSPRLRLVLAASLLGIGGCGEPSPAFHHKGASSWNVIVPRGFDRVRLLQAVKEHCGEAAICNVSAYTDEAYLSPGVSEDERWRATVFNYSRNLASGFEQVLWDCSIYPDVERGQCRGSPIVDPEL